MENFDNGNEQAVITDTNVPLWYIKTRNATFYLLGVIEVLLAFRFIFRLLGANTRSAFVEFLYSVTGIFIAPFSGIFNPFVSGGLVTRSVFEPATLIGMIIYSVAAWGIVRLIRLKAIRDGMQHFS